MNIVFYNNYSETIAFPKDLKNSISVRGTLREECDVLSPIITVENTSTFNITYYNYALIEDFNRYYFIDNYNYIANNLIEISLSVDVLESYKYAILLSTQYVSRNENFNSEYMDKLSDEEPIKKIYNNSKYINDNFIQVFPTFSESRILFNNTSVSNFSRPQQPKYAVVLGGSLTYADLPKNINYNNNTILTQSNYVTNNCYVLTQEEIGYFVFACYQNTDILKSLSPFYTAPNEAIINIYELPFDIKTTGVKSDIYLGAYQKLSYNAPAPGGGKTVYVKGEPISLDNGLLSAYTFSINGLTIKNSNILHNDFTDYGNYTKMQIYLPFFGFKDIDNSIIENMTDSDILTINYSLDVTTATLYIKLRYSVNGSFILIYEDSTVIGVKISVSGKDYSDYNKSVVKTLAGLGLSVGTSLVTSQIANEKIHDMPKMMLSGKEYSRLLRAGVPVSTVEESYRNMKDIAKNAISKQSKVLTASSIMQGLSNLGTLGNGIYSQSTFNSNASYAYDRIPYIQFRKYHTYYPVDYGKMVGYPVENSVLLGLLKGFTICGQVHLEVTGNNLTERFGKCTKFELEEIENLLKSGVIINEVK